MFLEIDPSQTRIACGSNVCLRMGEIEQSIQRTFQGCFLRNFSSFGKAVSEENIFLEIIQSETRMPIAAMFFNGQELNDQSLQRTFKECFLPSFNSFGPAVLEEKIFQKSTNQKQEWPVAAMFVNGSGRNEQSLQRTFHRCFLPSYGSFGQAVSEEFFLQKSTNQKHELPVVVMFVNGSGRNEQSLQRIFHRCFRPIYGSFG